MEFCFRGNIDREHQWSFRDFQDQAKLEAGELILMVTCIPERPAGIHIHVNVAKPRIAVEVAHGQLILDEYFQLERQISEFSLPSRWRVTRNA